MSHAQNLFPARLMHLNYCYLIHVAAPGEIFVCGMLHRARSTFCARNVAPRRECILCVDYSSDLIYFNLLAAPRVISVRGATCRTQKLLRAWQDELNYNN